MYIGRKIIFRDKVSSTNDLAEELIKEGKGDDGIIIRADEQTAGRGQKGNSWESSRGMNLTISIILRPFFLAPEKQFILSKVISLGLCDLLRAYSDNISIKWPNDIYAGDDKIAGILIEHSITGNIIDNTVAGVGLNINQITFDSYLPNPVSLKMITGVESDIDNILRELCSHLNYWYTKLLDGDYSSIDREYLKFLYRANREAEYRVAGLKIKGTIRGVDPFGLLIIEDEGGSLKRFGFREISFIQQDRPTP